MRSGDLSDIKRVDAAVRRWERDLPYIKRPAYGRYAPSFCFGKPGIHIDLRNFTGGQDDFYHVVESVLLKRFYQPETRRKYLSCLRRFLNWLTIPVNRINGKCIYAYFANLKKRNIQVAAYSLHLCALRTIFDSFCDLEITGGMELPGRSKIVTATESLSHKLRTGGDSSKEEGPQAESRSCKLQRPTNVGNKAAMPTLLEEIDAVLQGKHSVRDLALLSGLLLLDIKLNELLNIRRKDVQPEEKKIIVWGGLGRREREIGLPEELTGFFIARMNELDEGDYLFSPHRDNGKPITGKGANRIIQRLLGKSGVERKCSCREVQRIGGWATGGLTSPKLRRAGGYPTKGEAGAVSKADHRHIGHLSVKLGPLKRRGKVVSADAELQVKTVGTDPVRLRGIRIAELSYDGPSVRFPATVKWEQELLWVSREAKERICGEDFRKKISTAIINQYLEKRKTCYIQREKVNAYWEKTG